MGCPVEEGDTLQNNSAGMGEGQVGTLHQRQEMGWFSRLSTTRRNRIVFTAGESCGVWIHAASREGRIGKGHGWSNGQVTGEHRGLSSSGDWRHSVPEDHTPRHMPQWVDGREAQMRHMGRMQTDFHMMGQSH